MTTSEAKQGAGLELQFDAEARAVIASNTPAAEAAPIDEAWLRQRLAEGGWGSLRFQQGAATRLLAAYHQGLALQSLPLADMVDAVVTVKLGAGAMTASLDIVPAQGGAPATLEGVLEQLALLGVSEGIDRGAIAAAVASGGASQQIIARGKEAQHGEDGYFEQIFPKTRDRAPRLEDSGQVDYRELGEIVVVKPGDALLRRHPPKPGIPGRTLLGDPLAANDGKAVDFGANPNGVAVSPDDPDLQVATIAGQPVKMADGVMIEPVFTVKAVTMESGNIHFEGNVVIKGDVAAGMTVQASGDIEIGGVAEQATLIAGGGIVVKNGVIGGLSRKSGEAQAIRCGGSFEAGYAQNARIEAGDSIIIDDTAMQCELTALNHILVGRKRRGCIVGGHHQATLSITAKVIGSPARIATNFDIGLNPALHKRMQDLAKRLDTLETQLLSIRKLLDLAAKNPGRIVADKVEQAMSTDATLSKQIADLLAENEFLNRKTELAKDARVVALECMHEGVEVRLGVRRFRVPHTFSGVAVGLDAEGQLGMLATEDRAGATA